MAIECRLGELGTTDYCGDTCKFACRVNPDRRLPAEKAEVESNYSQQKPIAKPKEVTKPTA